MRKTDPKDPYDRDLFLIPAVPSSGTSALAGVLHHLGVNMGNVEPEKNIEKRGYVMYEDSDTWKYCTLQQEDPLKVDNGRLSRTAFRFRSYINYRFMNDPPGPIGAKIPGVLCIHDPELESLPIITLNVYRQFEKCIASDRKTMWNAGKYDKIKDNPDLVMHFNKLRAADLGACVAGKMDLLTIHEPIVNITFDELVGNKEEVVPLIAGACELECTDEQIKSAIDFLDKDKKHS